MKSYVLSSSDRNALARLLSKDRRSPPRPGFAADDAMPIKAPDVLWALPPCETGMPAASMVFGSLVPTGVSCCIYRHSRIANKLEPVLDAAGNHVRKTVYNYYLHDTNGIVQIFQHRNGTWCNERPDELGADGPTTTPSPTTTLGPCTGDCIFTANSSLEWTGPTGGCANTTTSTTTTSTTSTTSTSTTTSTTPAPPGCFGKACRLVCQDTGTTPAPVGGITPAYTPYKYATMTACDDDCECFGAGEPCFLEDGELVSTCVGPDASTPTTTTTTLNPALSPCEVAELVYGAVAPGERRLALFPGDASSAEVCQDCSTGEWNIWPEVDQGVHEDPRVVVLTGKCVGDPCTQSTGVSGAEYVAYDLSGQLAGAVSPDMIESSGTSFKAYWKQCLNCGVGTRPSVAPPLWVTPDTPQEGITFDGNVVHFNTSCVTGPTCFECPNAPLPPPATTPVPTSTTTSTTTTLAPCSCPQPAFCPTVSGQCTKTVCQRGGSALPAPICGSTTTPAPNTCFDGLKWRTCPDCGYVGNSTTTTSTTTGAPCSIPSVDLVCVQGHAPYDPARCTGVVIGNFCVTQEYRQEGLCCPGYIEDYGTGPRPGTNCVGQACGSSVAVPCVVFPTTTTVAPVYPACAGGEALWEAVPFSPQTPHDTGPWVWELVGDNCECKSEILAPQICCTYDRPADPPSSGCDRTYTPCRTNTGYQPCCCTTPDPCNQSCTWNSPGGSTWTKIIDPCAPSCPCPAPSRVPSSTCDTYTVRCNDGNTTTTTSTTTTSTTTSAPTGACCVGGGCVAGQTSAACAALGGTWTGAGSDCTDCQGACCLPPGGTCFLTFESGCAASGGFVWGGIGTNCSPNPCPTGTTVAPTTTTTTSTTTTSTTTTTPAPEGACCFPTGCFVSQAVHCGGTYMGDGTTCLDCSGACCQPTGACSVSPANFCVAWGGTFGGYGTNCSPNPCPTTTGTTGLPTAPPP